jgi:hypothetical protein
MSNESSSSKRSDSFEYPRLIGSALLFLETEGFHDVIILKYNTI